MAGAEKKSLDSPDEVRSPDKTKVEMVSVGGAKVARMTLQPGWRWSECIRPVVGGDACQTHHLGVMVSGRLDVRHDDGTEVELGAGDAYDIQPGHDAWVVGDQPMVAYEFDSSTAGVFAKG